LSETRLFLSQKSKPANRWFQYIQGSFSKIEVLKTWELVIFVQKIEKAASLPNSAASSLTPGAVF
jgi:hypothetical protein